ncbi:hypothetical protein Tco_0378986 [Tanacetum coccineum]
MRSNELYKFSDGTLTRLLSFLEDITKNIEIEYLPKRRWSNLEKKRAHFMIKDINKLLKERRMMRSLEKFVGGRLYGTNLRLLQRTKYFVHTGASYSKVDPHGFEGTFKDGDGERQSVKVKEIQERCIIKAFQDYQIKKDILQSDHGKARRSISSSSSHHQGMSSHQHGDDDDGVETSRASTLSPTTYINSLHLLDYQNYQIPSSSEQTNETLFARQTTLLNQMQQMHEEMREGFKSFGKALNRVFSKKKK